MAGISSPAAFKRANSVTFFSGYTVEQVCLFSPAVNVFLQRHQYYVLKTLTQHHSVSMLLIFVNGINCVVHLFFVWCHVMATY